MPPSPPKWQDAAACTLLGLVAVLVFWPWLFAGRALSWGDLGVYFQPLLHFERGQLLRGTLPLWNPLIFCGTPFFGNPQMWPLYPSTALLPLLPAARFLTVSCVGHLALGGMFFYGFLRRGALNLGLWPSLVGATGFMLDGYVVSKSQYPNMLQALAWTPLVLLWAERLALPGRARAALPLGLALGLQLLAAHAQVTLYTAYLALVLAGFRLWGQPARDWLRSAGWGIVAGALALGLACGEWLPVVEARRLAARQSLTLAHVDRLHLPWVEVTNFILPYRFGSPLRGTWGGAGAAWETACYAGTLTLALALVAMGRSLLIPAPGQSAVRRETAFWLCVFAGSVWLATGRDGGLFRVVYAILPGMKLFHDPARLLLGTAVALPTLAALGLGHLLASPHLSPRAAAWAGAACLALLVVDMTVYDRGLYPVQPLSVLQDPAQGSAVVRAVEADPALSARTGRVLFIDQQTALDEFQSWTDYGAQMPGYVPRLAQTFLPNLPALAGVRDAGGYEPLALARSAQLSSLAVGSLRAPDNNSDGQAAQIAPLLGWMGVRAVVAYRPQPPPLVPGLAPLLTWADPGGTNHGFVRLNTQWQARARVYPAWQQAPPDAPFAPAGWMAALPVVEGRAFVPPAAAPGPPVPAAITRDDPDCVIITLPASPSPRLLMLADTDFPGWSVRVDNRPATLLRADGIFRAVVVAPGAQRATFSYAPVSVRLGLYVSLLTAAVCAGGGLYGRRKERR